MKFHLYILLIIFFISSIFLHGQTEENILQRQTQKLNQKAGELYKTNPQQSLLYSDSSLQILSSKKFSNERIQALSNKAFAYYYLGKPDSALFFLKEGLNYTNKFDNQKNKANILGQLGVLFLIQGELDSSLLYNNNSVKILKSLYENKIDTSDTHLLNLSKALSSTAQVHIKKGNYNKGFQYNIEALKFRELANAPPESIGKLTINIGGLYIYLKEYSNAEKYFLKALEIFESVEDSAMIEIIYGNLGIVYKNTGNFEDAIIFYQKSLKLNDLLGNTKLKATNLGNLATLYMGQDELQVAKSYYLDAMQLSSYINDKFTLAEMYQNLGLIYQKTNQIAQSKKYFFKCLELAKPEEMFSLIINAELALSELYAQSNDYKQAYHHRQRYHNAYDSVNNIDQKNKVAELQTQFETAEKEKEILLLNNEKALQDLVVEKQKNELSRQRMVMLLVTGVLLILIIIFYLIFNRYKLKKKNQQTELEKKNIEVESRLLRSQMNPHFIFNSLNSIQNFILKNENKQAENYLIKFSKLIRNVLNLSREPFVLLHDDIQTLDLNLQLEKLRMKDQFNYSIDINPEIDSESTYIPPMILQPYVENAVKHGVANISFLGKISIIIQKKDNQLLCIIEDNGVGRGAKQTKNVKDHKSLGTQLIAERFELIEKQGSGNISQKIVDLKDKDGRGIGTRVELLIPFEEE